MNDRDDARLVEEFFAAEREKVADQSADDLTWQRITREHRRGRRSGRWGLRVGAVAAAAGIAIATYVAWPQGDLPSPQPSAPTSDEPTGYEPTDPPLEDPAPDDPTGGVGETPKAVPTDFAVNRLSLGGVDHLFVTGGYGDQCLYDAVCAALLGSADAGANWDVVANLVPFGIDRVEFVDDRIGYGWSSVGSNLALTTDGGKQWTGVDLPVEQVERVFDVSVRDDRVVIAGGAGCDSAGLCTEAVVAEVAAGSAPTAADLVSHDVGPLTDLRPELSGTETFVVGRTADEGAGGDMGTDHGGAVVVQRIQAGRFESVAVPVDCATPLAFAAAVEGDEVFLACRTAAATDAASAEVAVASSTTGGRTWSGVGQGYAVPSGPVLLAASDADHLVLVSTGMSLTSADGGGTFSQPPEPEPTAGPGTAGLRAAPGGAVYAWQDQLSGDVTDPGYWASEDRGQTWQWVPLVGTPTSP